LLKGWQIGGRTYKVHLDGYNQLAYLTGRKSTLIVHLYTHVRALMRGQSGMSLYTTDNGPHMNSWPDAAMTPFRSEKNTNWEGAFRVPAMVRWPGHIKQGSVSNDIFSGHDWFPTLLAAAGDTGVKDRLSQRLHLFQRRRPARSDPL
jgi:arylsulfatase A-like enzyme